VTPQERCHEYASDTDGNYSKLLGAGGVELSLRTGERYRVRIRAERDAYLYSIHIDSQGVWRMLMAQDRAGRFPAPEEKSANPSGAVHYHAGVRTSPQPTGLVPRCRLG
jgi:hypothetical protein